VPVISFLGLGGRCAACHAVIPARYFWLEVLLATLGFLAFATYGPSLASVQALLLIAACVAIADIDARHQHIPNAVTYPMIGIGILSRALAAEDALVGAMVGAGVAALGYGLPRALTEIYALARGRADVPRDGIRWFLAMLGVWIGAPALVAITLGGCLLSLVAVLALATQGRAMSKPIKLGPFLVLTALPTLVPAVQRTLESVVPPVYGAVTFYPAAFVRAGSVSDLMRWVG
jgi:leader peptidase (prepilin peptidase)/N-methyltransferase